MEERADVVGTDREGMSMPLKEKQILWVVRRHLNCGDILVVALVDDLLAGRVASSLTVQCAQSRCHVQEHLHLPEQQSDSGLSPCVLES